MGLHLGKFVHTKTGKVIMSIILGFGLATIFRAACNNTECIAFHAPPLADFKDKIYKVDNKCVKYNMKSAKCDSKKKMVDFE
jgi:hypothetical protein